jgi:2-dehydro-3-deoxygalactonokinase
MASAPEPAALIAADWGTSSLRVWALSAGSILAERRSDEGMNRLQPTEFEPALRRQLAAMDLTSAPSPLRVVLCGMVGARQGWREAGYVDIPTDLGMIGAQAVQVPADGLDVRILPGLADRRSGREDVMRGEETQLLGLLLEEPALSGLVCLPGTHSKWVTLQAGRVLGFSTSMTGELFALLSQHSVLQHSLAGAAPSGDPDAPGFLRGVARGLAEPARLMAALFGIRAGSLLNDVSGVEAADTLSGLLIGAEVGGAGAAPGTAVTLVAGGSLGALYRRVLEVAGHSVRTVEAAATVQRGLRFAARQLWPGCVA